MTLQNNEASSDTLLRKPTIAIKHLNTTGMLKFFHLLNKIKTRNSLRHDLTLSFLYTLTLKTTLKQLVFIEFVDCSRKGFCSVSIDESSSSSNIIDVNNTRKNRAYSMQTLRKVSSHGFRQF